MARLGRPRTFDRDAAIDESLHLFWEHGYASTSLAQLKTAIGGGISAPSFYAAFGSKEALYEECVGRYLATYARVTECLWDKALPPRDALALALRRSAAMQCERGHPKGCMVAMDAMASMPHDDASAPLMKSRLRTRAGIRSCVSRAVESGELAADTPVVTLAFVFDSFLLGLTSLARDGAKLPAMESAIDEVLRLWDLHAAG